MKQIHLLAALFALIIVLPGCKAWMTNWGDTSPRQLVHKVPHRFRGKVIIVGAGAAGLAAAALLDKNGVKYQIIEATNHYGGRVGKNDSFADFPIDIGAEWIHHKKNILNRLIDNDCEPSHDQLLAYNTPNSYSWDGEKYKKISKLSLKLSYWSFPEYKYKNTTWYDYIDKYFAQKVKQHIVYNEPVTHIDYSGKQVKLTSKNGREFWADRVILTVPISILQKKLIGFTPALAAKKTKAIQSVEFYRGFKLFMKFSEKFYPDAIDCDTEYGEKTYYDMAFKKEAKDHVLGLLSTGASAEAYNKLGSDKKIVAAVLTELDKIYKGKASKAFTGKYLLQDWGKQPYIQGTWTANSASNKTLRWLTKPLQQKVYFAGETYNIYGQRSTVHGAIMSGYTAVYDLLEQ